jgi:hypothetical protein
MAPLAEVGGVLAGVVLVDEGAVLTMVYFYAIGTKVMIVVCSIVRVVDGYSRSLNLSKASFDVTHSFEVLARRDNAKATADQANENNRSLAFLQKEKEIQEAPGDTVVVAVVGKKEHPFFCVGLSMVYKDTTINKIIMKTRLTSTCSRRRSVWPAMLLYVLAFFLSFHGKVSAFLPASKPRSVTHLAVSSYWTSSSSSSFSNNNNNNSFANSSMWNARNPTTSRQHCYYKMLGVPIAASQADLKQAFRRLVKQYHPGAFRVLLRMS